MRCQYIYVHFYCIAHNFTYLLEFLLDNIIVVRERLHACAL